MSSLRFPFQESSNNQQMQQDQYNTQLLSDSTRAFLGNLIVEPSKIQNPKSTYNQLPVDCGFKQTITFATPGLHNHYQLNKKSSVESHIDTLEVTKTQVTEAGLRTE